MASKYIDAKTFEDFNINQKVMIETLNHNITKLTDAVVRIEIAFAELLGGQKVLKKIVYWMLGIFGLIVTGAVMSNIGTSAI